MPPGRLNHYYSRILQEVAFRTGGSFGKPAGVNILLTNRCVARCVHCHSWKLHSETGEMTTHEWENTFDELREWLGPIFFVVTGGETLLRKDSIQLAKYAANLGFWVEFLTNGYLMTPELAKGLVQSGVKRVTISLDGSNPDIHDKIRGKGDFFLNTTRAMRMLVEERNRREKNVEIRAKTTIMSHNFEDLGNIVRLVHELDIEGVEFQAIEPVYYSDERKDSKWYQNHLLWITDLKKLSEVIQRLRDLKSQGFPIINTVENLNLIENYFYAPEALAYRMVSHDYQNKDSQCRSWIGELQIMPDGGMKMCPWMNPFAHAMSGNLKLAWKNRAQCWKKPCQHIPFNS